MIYQVQHNHKGPGHLLNSNDVPLCNTKGTLLCDSMYEIEVTANKIMERSEKGFAHILAAPYVGYCNKCLKKAIRIEILK